MTDTKTALLDAAAGVVRREGALALTLEAVAREAGVSKGGLLYHFRTKEALVTALIARHAERFDAAVEERTRADPEGPGRFTRAFARLTLDEDPGDQAALMAAVALDPDLLAPARAAYAGWQRRAEADGLAPGVGTLVRLAMDGLWISELLGLAPPRGADRAALERALDALLHAPADPAGEKEAP